MIKGQLVVLLSQALPHLLCYACLAERLRTTEGRVRDTAQQLVLEHDWPLSFGPCHQCEAWGRFVDPRCRQPVSRIVVAS